MYELLDSALLTEMERQQLRRLFTCIESSSELEPWPKEKWTLDRADVLSNLDVYNQYVLSGERRRQEWAADLKRAVADIPSLAVFGVLLRSRNGLEDYPAHVIGRHLTFFVNTETQEIVFIIRGLCSE